jgi:hypothetical protein
LSEYAEVVQQDDGFRRELLGEVQLGIDAEHFMGTQLGQYLERRAQETALTAMQELKVCDPADTKRIQSLQNAVFRAESFVLWIDECIKEGLNAEQTLQEQG